MCQAVVRLWAVLAWLFSPLHNGLRKHSSSRGSISSTVLTVGTSQSGLAFLGCRAPIISKFINVKL